MFTDKMEDEKYKGKEPLVEDTKVRVLYETETSLGPDDKADYPHAGTNSIYSAILSRNEAVKDAKRLKTFLELRDKYVKKKVVFEDPLFPANDSSLFYSHKPPMRFEWKRPSVSACFFVITPFRPNCTHYKSGSSLKSLRSSSLPPQHMGGVSS